MKKFLIFIIGLFLFVPMIVSADTQAVNFTEAFEMAEIEPKVKDYKETDDQITLYLFWWTGCGHCHDELEYFNDILEEYKDKIKLRAYEIQNSDNSELRNKVANFFNIDGKGVPLLVIGENTFYGFGEEYESQIKEAIDTEYNKTEKYDLFKEMETKEKYDGSTSNNNTKKEEKSSVGLYLFAGVVIILIFGFVLYIVLKDQKKN